MLYNENNSFAVKWLKQLISKGLLPEGEVNDKSIVELDVSELKPTSHFFAGIGGWPLALQMASWPDIPVWTGSCPCQPFSIAGNKKGFSDDRDLWKIWATLIRQYKPNYIFGEQVANGLGKEWWDKVSIDLVGMGYSVGAFILGATLVNSPHERERLYWCALSDSALGNANSRNLWRNARTSTSSQTTSRNGTSSNNVDSSSTDGYWSNFEWATSSDGKARPIGPGIKPMANGVPNQLELLRGYGNAIVPQVAKVFVKTVMNYLDEVADASI